MKCMKQNKILRRRENIIISYQTQAKIILNLMLQNTANASNMQIILFTTAARSKEKHIAYQKYVLVRPAC